ncbi:MAG: FmdB family zinc ribbon protein [Planctomycetota bacterium]|jgi:putative FmdB family regulatory protein
MPTYDYECRRCHHAFEEFQSITANPLKKCPVCSKRSLERLIGAGAGVIFRGSGFYSTDYRSKEYKDKAKADVDKPSPSSDSKGSSDKGTSKAKSDS